MIIAYEREKEKNAQYPETTLYISILAIDPEYQHKGLATKFIEVFIRINKKMGFKYLKGVFNFSVQTNQESWNNHVKDLYESFGFRKRATKKYEDRTDIVMGLEPN